MGPSQRKVLLAPIVMLPSAGAAGFKAVVPGHGAAPPLGSGTLRDLAPDARDNMAIDIMGTLGRRHEEEEHVKNHSLGFMAAGYVRARRHKCSMISLGARRHKCSVFRTGSQA